MLPVDGVVIIIGALLAVLVDDGGEDFKSLDVDLERRDDSNDDDDLKSSTAAVSLLLLVFPDWYTEVDKIRSFSPALTQIDVIIVCTPVLVPMVRCFLLLLPLPLPPPTLGE